MSSDKREDDDVVELHIESTNPSDNREIPIDTNEKLSLLIESVARNACLPRISDSEPLEPKVIEPYVETVEKSLTILNVILDKFQRKQIKAIKELDPIDRVAVLNLLLFCGEHQHIKLEWDSEEHWVTLLNESVKVSSLWITDETNKLSNELLNKLGRMTRKTTPELITLYADMCVSKLKKQGAEQKHWAQHPGIIHCYMWMLSHIDQSELVAYIEELKCVPFICKVLTHHSTEYKMKALQCYLSLLSRMNDKDICRVFDADKLVSVMKQFLYASDLQLILPSIHCIVKLMEAKRNLRAHRKDALLVEYEWDLIDDLRDILISFIETSSPQVQITYMDAFSILIAFSRVCTLRWQYPIMQIIKRSISQREIHTSVLNMFEVYLLNTWPFIKSSCETYCSYLFKILLETSGEEALSRVYKCFYLIKTQCGSENERLNFFLSKVRSQVKNKRIQKLIDHQFRENEYEVECFTLEQDEEDE